jgi:hypothetical protein
MSVHLRVCVFVSVISHVWLCVTLFLLFLSVCVCMCAFDCSGKDLDAAVNNMKRFVNGRTRDTHVWEVGVMTCLPTLQTDIDGIRYGD